MRSLRIAIVASLVAPGYALANVGIPMLAYAWPVAWTLLLPVIALEALVARRLLRTTWRSSFKVSGLCNFISTLAGIPLAWAAVLLLGTVVHGMASVFPPHVRHWIQMPFHAAWIPPFRDMPPWAIPAAGALLCIPSFLASVWVERKVAQRFSPFPLIDLRRWSWRANLLTYSLVSAALACLALLTWLQQ